MMGCLLKSVADFGVFWVLDWWIFPVFLLVRIVFRTQRDGSYVFCQKNGPRWASSWNWVEGKGPKIDEKTRKSYITNLIATLLCLMSVCRRACHPSSRELVMLSDLFPSISGTLVLLTRLSAVVDSLARLFGNTFLSYRKSIFQFIPQII